MYVYFKWFAIILLASHFMNIMYGFMDYLKLLSSVKQVFLKYTKYNFKIFDVLKIVQNKVFCKRSQVNMQYIYFSSSFHVTRCSIEILHYYDSYILLKLAS